MEKRSFLYFTVYIFLTSIVGMAVTVHVNAEQNSYPEQYKPDPNDNPIKWEQWNEWRQLDDETVNVRIYSNWQEDPADYTMTQVEIDNLAVRFDTLKDKGNAILVMMAEDQDHPLLRSLLGRLVYAAPANPKPEQMTAWGPYTKIPYYDYFEMKRPDIEKRLAQGQQWSFQDADGNLMQDITVGFFISNSDGTQKIKIGDYKTHGPITRYVTTGFLNSISFIVSHPDYGCARTWAYQGNNVSDNLPLPVIKPDSDSAPFAVWGSIFDSQGNPAAGVKVSCETIKTPSKGVISLGWNYSDVLSDESGFFRYYRTPKNDEELVRFGQRIPFGSVYTLTFTSTDQAFEPFTMDVQNGQEARVQIPNKQEPDGNFHTFSFYLGSTKIEPEELKYVTISIRQENGDTVELKADAFQGGQITPNGKYSALYLRNLPGRLPVIEQFERIDVTDESPEELVFVIPLQTFSGQIIHAFTNEPMEGVFVAVQKRFSKQNFSIITDEQWTQLHALSSNPSIDDPVLMPLRQHWLISHIVRTNADGMFQIECPLKSATLVYFDKDYIGLKIHGTKGEHVFQMNENNVLEIPTMKMYPAAKVTFEYEGQDRLLFEPCWIIDRTNNPNWVHEFLNNDNRHDRDFIYDIRLDFNNSAIPNEKNLRSIYVPADISLQVQLKTPTHQEYDDYTFPQTVTLSQGQTQDLGLFSFEKNIHLYVEVVDAQGVPVEGVTVHTYLDTDNYYREPSISDQNGICEVMVPAHSSGKVSVTYKGELPGTLQHEVETILFKTQGPEDEGTTYTMRLSDEQLKLLFAD